MTNLLERLKPEHKQSLDQMYKPYPTTKRLIEDELKSKKFISEVNFETVNKLSEVLGVTKIDFIDIYNMFDRD